MGDLYSGLIQSQMGHKEFYGKYKNLNNIHIPDDATLLQMQIDRLQALERSGLKKYQNIETFLNTSQAQLNTLERDIENLSEEKIYARVIQLLNSGLYGNVEMNPTRRQVEGKINAKQKNQEIDNIIFEITNLLNQLDIDQGLEKNIVDTLEQRLRFQSGHKNQEYTQAKSDLAEELAAELLNKNPGFKAIATGKFLDSTNQMLLEDVMTFKEAVMNTPIGNLKFTVHQDGRKTTSSASSIQDFLSQIDQLNGQYTITLSNPLYDALKKGSVLSAQVKSGRGVQALINKTKQRNAMNLKKGGFAYTNLVELYEMQTHPTQWFKPQSEQYSKDLEALANYSLSKAVGASSLTSNQLYFTSHGIVTASQWMKQNGYMLKFSPGVTSIGPNFLTQQRPYHLKYVGMV